MNSDGYLLDIEVGDANNGAFHTDLVIRTMKKAKTFELTRFTADALLELARESRAVARQLDKNLRRSHLFVEVGGERWSHDEIDEFLADYRRSTGIFSMLFSFDTVAIEVSGSAFGSTDVTVTAPDRNRIESVFAVAERHAPSCRIPTRPQPKPTIFIGHGGSTCWRDLKDHLTDQHAHQVEAYEIGSRAGHSIRDVLEGMLKKSSLAILVMTGDDLVGDGQARARQNVVHEAGLFQGRLGFDRAIVALEEGTEAFSNIAGIHQLRFSKGNIKEIFGHVLAWIRRESNR